MSSVASASPSRTGLHSNRSSLYQQRELDEDDDESGAESLLDGPKEMEEKDKRNLRSRTLASRTSGTEDSLEHMEVD
jgi:hypothetical protein